VQEVLIAFVSKELTGWLSVEFESIALTTAMYSRPYRRGL
jgi:hypothetical protein